MNNFNKIFTIVKQLHSEDKLLSGTEAINGLAAEVGINPANIHFYLDSLQMVGLIRYDAEQKTISLTYKGIETESLFE